MSLPRGIRNKNAGNIERSNRFQWQGELRPAKTDPIYDERFCVFSDPAYGLRAMMKLLINYNQKHGINTLKDALNRWAPHHENDTNAYVKNVAKWADINPNAEWDFTDPIFLVPVVKAMVRVECGHPSDKQIERGATPYQWYSNKEYQDAYELAKRGRITSHSMNVVPEKKPEVKKPKFFSFITKLFGGYNV